MATANYSNATLNIPDGGLYRGTTSDLNAPGAIYFRNGNTIAALDIANFANNLYKQQNVAPVAGSSNDAFNSYSAAANSSASYQSALDYLKSKYGIDWNSLPQYNIADAQSAFSGAGYTTTGYDLNNIDAFGNLIKNTTAPAGGNVDFTQNTGGATGTQTVTTPSGAQVTVPNAAVKVPTSGSSTMAQYPAQTANQGAVNPGTSPSGIPGTPAATTPTTPIVTPPSTVLQPGSADAANVGKLQDYLVSLGLLQPQDLLNGGRGIYGPKTTAAVAALQSALGVDNSTGVGYFGPKTIAALASKTNSSGTGSATGDSQTANTGTPTTPNTANGRSPAENVQDVYTKLYAASGLSDIKSHYEQTLKQQQDLTNEMNEKIAGVRNNPWMSQSEVDRNVKNIQDKYSVKLDTLSHFATLYETIYKDGLDEIQFRTGLAEHDIQRAFEAAQKRQDALDKLAQSDIHSETVNGRKVLVDYKTKKIVADLGADKSGTGTMSNQQIDNERSLLTQFVGQQIVKDYNTILAKKKSVDAIIQNGTGGPGDLSLVYEFMKALDPTSVVRESEYATAAKSGNIFLGTLAKFNGYLKENGGFLPENVKSSFQSIINSKLQVQEDLYNNTVKQYQDLARRQGLNPANVTIDFGAANTPQQERFTPGSIVVDDVKHIQYLIGPDGITKIPIGSAL